MGRNSRRREERVRHFPPGWFLRTVALAFCITFVAFSTTSASFFKLPQTDRLTLVRKHLKNQKLDRAMREVNRVLAADPSRVEGWRLKGEIFLRRADLDGALLSWQEAYRLAPTDFELATSIGDLLIRRNDRLDEALAIYTAVLSARPENVRLHVLIGSIHERRDRWADAAHAYRNALAIDPNQVRARSSLGVVLFKQGEYEAAGHELRKAIELSPRDLRSRVFSGLSQNHLGKYEAALDELKEALLIDPHAANQILGVRDQIPHFQSLVERYQQAYEHSPREAGRSFDLAVIFFYAEDFDSAWKFLTQAERLRYPIPLELKEVIYSRRRLRGN